VHVYLELIGLLLVHAEGVEPGHSMELLGEGIGCSSSFLGDLVGNLLLEVVDRLLVVDNPLCVQVERSFKHLQRLQSLLLFDFSGVVLLLDDVYLLQLGGSPFLDELV